MARIETQQVRIRLSGTPEEAVLLLRDGEVVASGPLGEALTAENLSATFGLDITLTQEAGRYAARAV